MVSHAITPQTEFGLPVNPYEKFSVVLNEIPGRRGSIRLLFSSSFDYFSLFTVLQLF